MGGHLCCAPRERSASSDSAKHLRPRKSSQNCDLATAAPPSAEAVLEDETLAKQDEDWQTVRIEDETQANGEEAQKVAEQTAAQEETERRAVEQKDADAKAAREAVDEKEEAERKAAERKAAEEEAERKAAERKAAEQRAVENAPKKMKWMTAAECEAAGLPAVGALAHLLRAPWDWDEEAHEVASNVGRWECVSFPWTPFNMAKFLKHEHVEPRLEDQDLPTARMVQHLVQGKMWFVEVPSAEGGSPIAEQIVSSVCVRIIDPHERFLVEVNASKIIRGYTYARLTQGNPDAPLLPVAWPHKKCAKPKDIIAEAQEIVKTECNIPAELLTFTRGQTVWSEPENDKYLTCLHRHCRYFVDARVKEPVSAETEDKLGLESGSYTWDKKGTAGDASKTFEWWDPEDCDDRLPGGASGVLDGSGPVNYANPPQGDTVPLQPWTEDEVGKELRKSGVDMTEVDKPFSSQPRNSGDEDEDALQLGVGFLTLDNIAQRLARAEWTLVRNTQKVDGSLPTLALLQSDKKVLFFPPAGSAAA